jgi:hypothetical protein
MGHLSPHVLLDIAEGVRPESSEPHLARCVLCRRQVDNARQALATVAGTTDAPEPSPLYWDHLSARVRDAVAAEEPSPTLEPRRWLSWPLTAAVSAGVVVIAVGLGLRGRPALRAPAVVDEAVTRTVIQTAPLQADESFTLIAELAAGLDWESAAEAGLIVTQGATEDAISALSAEERMELRRLLAEELAGGDGIL